MFKKEVPYTKEDQLELGRLLHCSTALNVIPARSIRDRTWIMFEFDYTCAMWRSMPAGLAIMAKYGDPEIAFQEYKLAVINNGWSYELAAEKLTGIPKELLVEVNKAYIRYSLEEIIYRLYNTVPLLERSIGPRIIDKLSEPD